MIKLCQLRKQPTIGQSSVLRLDQSHQQTFLRSAAHLSPSGAGTAPGRPQFGRSGSGILMPATQQPARTGALARRARLSPAMSLFNRLDGFVLQLQSSRDFFAHWPDQICQRIRSNSIGPKISTTEELQHQQQPQRTATTLNANQQQQPGGGESSEAQQNASAVCWTGQNYGSYTKRLVEFGKANLQDHPEVPIGTPTRINEMILTFIEKFRLINDQLMRQSYKLPMPSGIQYYATRTRAVGPLKSGELRRSSAGAPPLSPQARISAAPGEQVGQSQTASSKQQLIVMSQALALATSMPQSVQDEANESGAGEVTADESNLDESSAAAPDDGVALAESAPSDQDEQEDEDEEEEDEQGQNAGEPDYPCKLGDCTNLLDQTSAGAANSMGPEISDEQLNRLQQSRLPANLGEDDQQQQQKEYEVPMMRPSSPRQPMRIPSQFTDANPYPTPTVTWTAYENSSFGRHSSASSASHLHQLALGSHLLPMLILLVGSTAWLVSSTRRMVLQSANLVTI